MVKRDRLAEDFDGSQVGFAVKLGVSLLFDLSQPGFKLFTIFQFFIRHIFDFFFCRWLLSIVLGAIVQIHLLGYNPQSFHVSRSFPLLLRFLCSGFTVVAMRSLNLKKLSAISFTFFKAEIRALFFSTASTLHVTFRVSTASHVTLSLDFPFLGRLLI